MTLKTQPTFSPTRKVWAMILAGMVTGALQSFITAFAPETDLTAILPQIDVWVQTVTMAVAAYMTKDRA